MDGQIDDSIVANNTVAEYVRQTLNGQELEANTNVSVPVPLETDVTEHALDELEADREELESTNTDDIDETNVPTDISM